MSDDDLRKMGLCALPESNTHLPQKDEVGDAGVLSPRADALSCLQPPCASLVLHSWFCLQMQLKVLNMSPDIQISGHWWCLPQDPW